jgi:hypothetical protein
MISDCSSPDVFLVHAPESWAPYFKSGSAVVPSWLTERDILDRRAIAAELQKLLGAEFEIDYSPNAGTDDFPPQSMGHVMGVTFRGEVDAGFDMRNANWRDDLAAWLGELAAAVTQARQRVLGIVPQPQPELPDAPLVTFHEAYDVATDKVLFRSLNRADCLDFQRGAGSTCQVRDRDALLCSAAAKK